MSAAVATAQRPATMFRLPRWKALAVFQATSTRGITSDALLDQIRATPADVVWAEQVHGNGIMLVSSAHRGQACTGCDALVTQEARLPLAIRTADCAPLFIYDARRHAIGMAHVGWRGLAAELPAALIRCFEMTFHSDPSMIHVGIGPTIRSCCYPVHDDVAACLPDDCKATNTGFVLDLPDAISRRLLRCGVTERHISDGAMCTSCHVDRCYSVRHEGARTGRLLSLVMLAPR